MIHFFSLILKNSVRNRRRSILTICSIAASLCLLGTLMALYQTFFLTEATPEQALRLITRNRVSLANPLPISYEQQIERVPGVKAVMIFQWFGGTYKDARDPANFFGRFAIEPKKLGILFPEYKLTDEERKAFESERQACVVGSKTAARHNFKPGDRITLVGDIFPVKLELVVRGIYQASRDNENLFFHYAYLNESLSRGRMDSVSTFSIVAENAEAVAAIPKAVDDLFRNSPQQTKTETERAFEVSFLAFIGNVKVFLLVICSAVAFTILLVTGNTVAMSVRERIREVGILKTIGFTPGKILGLLIGESVAMAVIGGLVGLALAFGVCALLRTAPSTFADLSRITIDPLNALLCVVIAAFIGVVSSVIPSYSASRKSIVDALRFND